MAHHVTLVGDKWVLPLMVRESILCLHGSFVGKKRKKGLNDSSPMPFLDYLV